MVGSRRRKLTFGAKAIRAFPFFRERRRQGSKGQARPFGRLNGRNRCAGSKGGIRLGRGSGREWPDGIQSAQGWGMGEEPQRGSSWGESILPDGAELAQCQWRATAGVAQGAQRPLPR